MRTIVLDTNCLLVALPSKSPYHKVWTDILDGKVCLCVSNEVLDILYGEPTQEAFERKKQVINSPKNTHRK